MCAMLPCISLRHRCAVASLRLNLRFLAVRFSPDLHPMARTKKHSELDELLTARNERMQKLQGIVKDAIDEQELIINNLANPPHEEISRGQRLADKVASFGGSWTFIVCSSLFSVPGSSTIQWLLGATISTPTPSS